MDLTQQIGFLREGFELGRTLRSQRTCQDRETFCWTADECRGQKIDRLILALPASDMLCKVVWPHCRMAFWQDTDVRILASDPGKMKEFPRLHVLQHLGC